MKKALVLGVMALFTIGIANLNAQERTATPQKPEKTFKVQPTEKKATIEKKATPAKKTKTKIDMKGSGSANASTAIGVGTSDKNKENNAGTTVNTGKNITSKKNTEKDPKVADTKAAEEKAKAEALKDDKTSKAPTKEPARVIPPKPQVGKATTTKDNGKANR